MSFLYDALHSWWSALWRSLGLYRKEGSLLLLGLDNAGKTTLLHRLSSGGEVRPFPPTDRPRQDSFRQGGIAFKAWDLGGHEAVRHLWEDYVPQVSAVLFLVDATDHERFEEAGYELDALLGNRGEGIATSRGQTDDNGDDGDEGAPGGGGPLSHVPIALMLNKCDVVDQAATTDEVLDKIDFDHLLTLHPPDKLKVFRISVLTGDGYPEAFRWVAGFLQ